MWGILGQEQPKEENGETDAEEAKEKSLKLNKRAMLPAAQDGKSNRFWEEARRLAATGAATRLQSI